MDYLAKLHWDYLIAEHLDPTSERTKEAIRKYNQELDRQLDSIFQGRDAAKTIPDNSNSEDR